MRPRRQDPVEDQACFHGKTPVSITRDGGKTWEFSESEFPAISSAQRAAMIRLREGPILLCSFTDQGRDWKQRKGLTFKAADGSDFTGYGLFAAVSVDEGKTWPFRRVIASGGEKQKLPTIDRGLATFSDTMSEPTGYLAITQTCDDRIQLLSSKNHCVFNLAWLKYRLSRSENLPLAWLLVSRILSHVSTFPCRNHSSSPTLPSCTVRS